MSDLLELARERQSRAEKKALALEEELKRAKTEEQHWQTFLADAEMLSGRGASRRTTAPTVKAPPTSAEASVNGDGNHANPTDGRRGMRANSLSAKIVSLLRERGPMTLKDIVAVLVEQGHGAGAKTPAIFSQTANSAMSRYKEVFERQDDGRFHLLGDHASNGAIAPEETTEAAPEEAPEMVAV